MLAIPLGVEGAGFFRFIGHHSLGFLDAAFNPFCESTTCRATQLHRNLYTLCYWAELGLLSFAQGANFFRPLGASCEGGVAGCALLALFFLLSLAFWNIVFNLMFLLIGHTFTLILGGADLLPLLVAVLHQGGPAHVHRHVGRRLAVFYETLLHKIFTALFLLCRGVDGDLGLLAPLVVGVVAGLHVLPHQLLLHDHLLNTPFLLNSCSSNSIKLHIWLLPLF